MAVVAGKDAGSVVEFEKFYGWGLGGFDAGLGDLCGLPHVEAILWSVAVQSRMNKLENFALAKHTSGYKSLCTGAWRGGD